MRDNPDIKVGVLVPQGYVLEDDSFVAVSSAVNELYDENIYNLCLLEAPAGEPIHYEARWADGPVWFLPNTPILRNCIYSPDARWGVYFSEVDIAVIGGPADFLDAVAANLGITFDQQLERLVAHARDVFGRRPPLYLQPLLSKLEGSTSARRRIEAAGFLSVPDP
jgi:hypothetical protein